MLAELKSLGTQEKRLIMTAGIFLLGGLIGWRMLIAPDLEKVKRFSMKYQADKRKGETFQQIVGLETRLKKYDAALSKSLEADELMQTVNRLGAESGLALLSATPQTIKEDADYQTGTLAIEAGGGFHALGKFVEKIENSSPFIKVNRLNVAPEQGYGPVKGLRIEMVIGAYRSKGVSA